MPRARRSRSFSSKGAGRRRARPNVVNRLPRSSAAQHVDGRVDGCAPKVGGRQRNILDVSTSGQDAQEDGLQDVLGVGRIPGDAQGRAEYRLVVALVRSANPATGVVEGMGIGSSSIWVLAVVTSSASLTMTHEEADYYRGARN